MAGEWFPVDVNLADKPEVLELCELTGLDVEVVVFRLFRLWGWFQMHSSDGDARVTLKRFTTVAGGDAKFWQAVTRVGWLEETEHGIRIPKWSDRFSNSAKSKKRAALRQKHYRERVTVSSRSSDADPSPYKKRREEKTNTNKAPSSASSVPAHDFSWNPAEGWKDITATDRKAWAEAYPATDLSREMARADQWLRANPTKSKRKAWRRFLTSWFGRVQDSGGSKGSTQSAGPKPQSEKKFWRDEFCRNMTDREFANAKRTRSAAGSVSLDLAETMTAKVKQHES